jgi:Flp pilus assembly protein TadG
MTTTLSTHSKRRLKDSRGSALVELAICLPVLVMTIVGIVDFARVFYTAIELQNAARAGAQYGAYNLAQSGSNATMQTTATGAVNITGVTAVASRFCQCANDAGTFSSSALPQTGGAGSTACTAPVAASCHLDHRVMTVTVTASKTFTTVANYIGVPSSIALSRTATLRVSE